MYGEQLAVRHAKNRAEQPAIVISTARAKRRHKDFTRAGNAEQGYSIEFYPRRLPGGCAKGDPEKPGQESRETGRGGPAERSAPNDQGEAGRPCPLWRSASVGRPLTYIRRANRLCEKLIDANAVHLIARHLLQRRKLFAHAMD
jgi:hypothetical protein